MVSCSQPSPTSRASSGLRAVAGLAAAALVLVGQPPYAEAQAYRDGLAVPAHRLLRSMVAQLSEGEPTQQMAKPLALLAPLTDALRARYSVDLVEPIERSLAARDREAALASVVVLVAVDAQDLAESIRHSDIYGWQDGLVQVKRSYLDYEIISAEVRRRDKGVHAAVIEDFAALAARLKAADFTTSPDKVEPLKAKLVADLLRVRALCTREPRPGRGEHVP